MPPCTSILFPLGQAPRTLLSTVCIGENYNSDRLKTYSRLHRDRTRTLLRGCLTTKSAILPGLWFLERKVSQLGFQSSFLSTPLWAGRGCYKAATQFMDRPARAPRILWGLQDSMESWGHLPGPGQPRLLLRAASGHSPESWGVQARFCTRPC